MISVEFIDGPEDGLQTLIGDECYQLRFPMAKGAAALLEWAQEGDPGGCYVYERDPGSDKFVYAGVS